MRKEIPYKKIFRLAIFTTPLFGLFGATPIFMFPKMNMEIMLKSFLLVSLIILLFWMLNLYLYVISRHYHFKGKDWVRYGLGIIVAGFIVYFFSDKLFQLRTLEIPPDAFKIFSQNLKRPFLPEQSMSMRFIMPILQYESINIIIIVLLELLLLRENKQKVDFENTQLRMVNLEAKHNLLKQQLHPHFLFNSLSTLNSLIKRSPIDAEQYLLKLSELLRFSTSTNAQALITINEELELCKNYLNMQQVRFGKALLFKIDIPPEMTQAGKIPVYSIQLLVENAIKHNSLTVETPLFIKITGDQYLKSIKVSNNLQEKLNLVEEQGIGLANLKERYNLLCDDGITINKSGYEFTVIIKVIEDENCNY